MREYKMPNAQNQTREQREKADVAVAIGCQATHRGYLFFALRRFRHCSPGARVRLGKDIS